MIADSAVDTALRWVEYTRRLLAWREANPGAYPSELADFEARLRMELGL